MKRSSISSVYGRIFSIKSLNLKYLAILVLAMVCLPFLAYGQNATIVGTVTDPSGAVIPNVAITITHAETGRVITSSSNDAGQFVVVDLPIGHFTVKASVTGFKVSERTGIVLSVGDRERVDFQLALGTTAQSVSVEANPVAVQTDTGQVDSLVSGTQISELATNGRTLYSYIALTPGASSLNPDSQLPVPTGGASSSVSFNGARTAHNLYLLDGGENSDRGGAGSSSVLPSTDAIAEMQTLTSNYSAEYGLSSGATISSVLKSGSKTLHASAWEFLRNDALQANNFFYPKSELRYNIFGFNVGGPVTLGKAYNPSKTKTFFFYNMEWRKFISPSGINTKVPAASEYPDATTGIASFGSNTITVPSATGNAPVAASVLLQNCPAGTTLASLGLTQGEPFPNNQIPSCMISPNANALLVVPGSTYGGIFPKPNNGIYYTKGVSAPTDLREEIVRIDHNFSDKFTIYGHFVAETVAQTMATTMWSGDNVPSVANTFGNPSYAGVVHAAYTISPTLVNEVAFNYNGNRIAILPTGLATAPSDFTFNRFFTGPNNGDRIPTISLGTLGTNYTSNWTPWNNKADDYQIRDDVSWTKGRHQLKMGGSWALYAKIQDWFKNTQGNFNFSGSYTGNDFADMLLGLASSYSEDAVKATGDWKNTSWAAYVQDNYRVNNRLTLNLGLRWDGIPHTYEASNYMANFYPDLYDSANAATLLLNGTVLQYVDPGSKGLGTSPNPIITTPLYTNGIAICGTGVPKGCVNDAWMNFQPRLGFAYDLRGNGKTVIRGGYGIMNERIQGNDVYNNAGTPPLAASVNFGGVSLDNPTLSLSSGAVGGSVNIPVASLSSQLDRKNYRPPLSSQFSLGIQQALGKSVLSVSYVGAQNRHQSYFTEINLPAASLLPTLATSQAARDVYNGDLPYLGYNNIQMARDEANSNYNGLQIGLRGSLLSNDLTYQLGYTFSYANDPAAGTGNSGDLINVSNPYAGWKYDMGPSIYDHRQVFFTNFVYDLPLFKHSDNHFMKTVAGGWEISGIVTAESGSPINIGLINASGGVNFVTTGNSANRPDVAGSGSDPHTRTQWFNTSIYSFPAAGTWGNVGRDSVVGPGRDNWNVSLFKNFLFSESRGSNLQFRAEFFNLWNHTQWWADSSHGGISNNYGASDFGTITSAYDPRTIQLALKLYF